MKASPWARCVRWRLRPTQLPTWFKRVPTASCGSLVHYWVAPHRQSIDSERTTAATNICVVRGASGAHGMGASGGRSDRCLQPASTWTKVTPMRFLSLTERNIGVAGPLDAVYTHFDTLFTFTPHPIPDAPVLAVSHPHPSRAVSSVGGPSGCCCSSMALEDNDAWRLQSCALESVLVTPFPACNHRAFVSPTGFFKLTSAYCQ